MSNAQFEGQVRKRETTMTKPIRPTQGFDKLLLESVDETLSVLGEEPKSTFYKLLDCKFAMKQSEIAFRAEEFNGILEDVFGSGAAHLQLFLVKRLQQKIVNSFF
jgi:hypothetical protein